MNEKGWTTHSNQNGWRDMAIKNRENKKNS